MVSSSSGTPPPPRKGNGPRRSGIPRRVSQAASRGLILNETDDEENDDKENSHDASGDLTLTDLRGPPPVAPSRPNASKPRVPGGASALSKSRMASVSASRRGGDAPGGPSSDANAHAASGNDLTSSRRTGGVAALARSHGPRRSLGASLNAAAAASDAAHEGAAKEVVKLNVDSTSFEEWMKMATDNKINSTNTWSFALIDYFHDMSLLRSDTGDGTINFQKASCTLDGCIKVWTSRVDSVVVETGKLLSGLQDDVEGKKGRSGKDGDDEEGEDGEDDEGSGAGGKKKKRSKAKEATLVKSFNQIAAKRLDLEFTVDPLFKKTSADFDEGGAGGLLMNHLGVDGKVRIVFDAGDVADVTDGAEEQVAEDVSEREKTPMPEAEAQQESVREEDLMDLESLRVTLFGEDEAVYAEGDSALGALINHRTVCPTFSAFRFAADDDTPFGALASHYLSSEGHQYAEDDGMGSIPPDSVEGDFGGFDDGPDDFGGEGVDVFGSGGGEADDGEYDDIFGNAAPGASQGVGGHLLHGGEEDGAGPSSVAGPSGQGAGFGSGLAGPGDRGLQLAFKNPEDADGEGAAEGDMFDYFDRQLTKNWAGPEHWKMRKGVFGSVPNAGKGMSCSL
ncbi:Chromosome condensation complex Condensin, subunit H [Ceraceosorus bombacis]|uniref:Condensin complex subunit 2 n=1 Tax=Ceraceosorus bombacis TaxID=401625 RepID=A0A0P1BJ33_9BASI|nr:Chromosome condensation complex Condensin, subunit H [Ceraceosorus bombacis]